MRGLAWRGWHGVPLVWTSSHFGLVIERSHKSFNAAMRARPPPPLAEVVELPSVPPKTTSVARVPPLRRTEECAARPHGG